MGESLWAQLGVRFLQELYRNLIDAEGFIAFLYDASTKHGVQGFIAGATSNVAWAATAASLERSRKCERPKPFDEMCV